MGYVDAAKKTVTAVDGKAYTVRCRQCPHRHQQHQVRRSCRLLSTPPAPPRTTLHGMYVYPMTSTTGTVKSIAKENGVIVSVTLADGTVLKQSVLANNAGDREYYVIGNVYTFVLDSHGHVMYATKDYARTLWAYTGEWRATGNYGDINTDRGREYRFINVSTGEFAFYPVRFVNRNDEAFSETLFRPAYGQYFDISATAGNDGRYVASSSRLVTTTPTPLATLLPLASSSWARTTSGTMSPAPTPTISSTSTMRPSSSSLLSAPAPT
ncbi:MAG: hypothetical protein ACLTSG_02355 [Lachnospiraceae bacterium]